jgi:glycosyltransferase involved in cell wall biosynthesis
MNIKVVALINDILLGGAQTVVLQMATGFAGSNIDFRVCYFKDSAKVRPGDLDLSSSFIAARIRSTNFGAGKRFSLASFIGLVRYLRRERPDILHCHLPFSIILGSIAAKLAGVKKVIAHEHNTYDLGPRRIRLLRKLVQPLITTVICYAESVEQEMSSSFKLADTQTDFASRKSFTIYNPIDLEKVDTCRSSIDVAAKRRSLGLSEHAIIVTSTGRLVPWKGHAYLINAFKTIAEKHLDAHLVIIGWGQQEQELRDLVIRLGLSEHVHLLGARTDVYEILAASDIFSYVAALDDSIVTESVSVGALEAMAFGLPVLVANYAAAHKFIADGVNGYLVTAKDVVAIARTLDDLVLNPETRKSVGLRARLFIEEHMSLSSVLEIYRRLYASLAV